MEKDTKTDLIHKELDIQFTKAESFRCLAFGLVASSSGFYLGYTSVDNYAPDTTKTAEADEVLAGLSSLRDSLKHKLKNNENIERQAQELVIKTLLSKDLSEQQIQNFITDIDNNIIDISSIGFAELDNSKDFSHIRECRTIAKTSSNAFNQASNIASCNAGAGNALICRLIIAFGITGFGLGLFAEGRILKKKAKKMQIYKH